MYDSGVGNAFILFCKKTYICSITQDINAHIYHHVSAMKCDGVKCAVIERNQAHENDDELDVKEVLRSRLQKDLTIESVTSALKQA